MSERKIVDYIIIFEDCLDDLYENVQKRILEGYQPFGSPMMTVNSINSYCNAQAMVKYEYFNNLEKQKNLRMNIDELLFNKRIKNALASESIYTIHDLINIPIKKLKQFPNLGKTSINFIKEVVEDMGLKLKD